MNIKKKKETMKRIKAIIEKADDGGYGIYAEGEGIPLFSSGLTEQEAKDEFESLIHEQAKFMKEKQGSYPEWYSEDVEIDYRYDMSGFFMAFPFINVSEFAKSLDINPSLMRKYKSGIAKAGERQKDLIQRKFDDIVSRLSTVRF